MEPLKAEATCCLCVARRKCYEHGSRFLFASLALIIVNIFFGTKAGLSRSEKPFAAIRLSCSRLAIDNVLWRMN